MPFHCKRTSEPSDNNAKESPLSSGITAGFAGLCSDWERRFPTLGIVPDKLFRGKDTPASEPKCSSKSHATRSTSIWAPSRTPGGTNEQSKRAINKFGGIYKDLLRN